MPFDYESGRRRCRLQRPAAVGGDANSKMGKQNFIFRQFLKEPKF